MKNIKVLLTIMAVSIITAISFSSCKHHGDKCDGHKKECCHAPCCKDSCCSGKECDDCKDMKCSKDSTKCSGDKMKECNGDSAKACCKDASKTGKCDMDSSKVGKKGVMVGPGGAMNADNAPYFCPMHCKTGFSDKPGKCPECGMDLKERK